MHKRTFLRLLPLVAALIISGCGAVPRTPVQQQSVQPPVQIKPVPEAPVTGQTGGTNMGEAPVTGQVGAQMANPASVNCLDKGGRLEMAENPAGQYGICVFPDNKKCEEWAMMRGDCPVGGVNISSELDQAETFCALRGGTPVRDALNGVVHLCDYKGQACPSQKFFENNGCE